MMGERLQASVSDRFNRQNTGMSSDASDCVGQRASKYITINAADRRLDHLSWANRGRMDRQTLCDWVHRYNASGVEGLKSRCPPGRVPALTEQQRAELRELVVKGPDPAIDKVVRWRCVDLRAAVAHRFSVTVRRD